MSTDNPQMIKNPVELGLFNLLLEAGLPRPEPQYKFAYAELGRKWAADFCWVEQRLIVEIQGGVWSGGRHTSGSGYTKDCEKLNMAQELGYRVLYYTPQMIKANPGGVINQIKRLLKTGGLTS